MDIEAVVLDTQDGYAVVKVSEQPGGCGRCHESGGCASGVLTQIFKRQTCRTFRLPNTINARQGERVMVSLADGVTLKTALAVYMLPVLCIILGAWGGTWLGGDDRLAILGAFGGFAVSLLLVGVYRRRQAADAAAQPALSRRLLAG